MKNLLLEIKYITKSLSSTENNLRRNAQDISEEDWNVEIEKIEILKTKLQENLEILDNPVFVRNVAKCVSKRKQKRLAVKARKQEFRERMEKDILRRAELHKEIDGMLADIANEHKKELQVK